MVPVSMLRGGPERGQPRTLVCVPAGFVSQPCTAFWTLVLYGWFDDRDDAKRTLYTRLSNKFKLFSRFTILWLTLIAFGPVSMDVCRLDTPHLSHNDMRTPYDTIPVTWRYAI